MSSLRLTLTATELLALILAVGAILVLGAGATGGMSRAIYLYVDLPGFMVVLVTALALAGAVWAMPERHTARLVGLVPIRPVPGSVPALAAVALGVAIAGIHLAYHGYAFSMDEWMTRLQGEIFLAGQISGVVPEPWRELGRTLYHSFAAYEASTGRVASDYRPGMALIWAGFEWWGLGLYASAVMNALAVLVVARVARQLFPDAPSAPLVAALLLAGSQQALAAAMTSYAMSAHLLLNLVWISLFLSDRVWTHVVAALIGVATASLHQVHMHAAFALPFLLTLLRPMRPRLVLMYGVVYGLGHTLVYAWDWISINRFMSAGPEAGRDLLERVARLVQVPDLEAWGDVGANVARLFGWQSLALVPLLMLAARFGPPDRRLRLLVLSLGTSLLPYLFLMPDQGHGWGYRYLHGLLGHLALLAVPGWLWLITRPDLTRMTAWVAACLVIAPILLVPFRFWQIDRMVGPYARASALAAAQDADVVIVDSSRAFYGWDIPRNAAVRLAAPVQIPDMRLSSEDILALCNRYNVAVLGPEALAAVGVPIRPPETVADRTGYERRRAALTSSACQRAAFDGGPVDD